MTLMATSEESQPNQEPESPEVTAQVLSQEEPQGQAKEPKKRKPHRREVRSSLAARTGRRSTKAELDREKATALVIQMWATGETIDRTVEVTGLPYKAVMRIRDELTPEFVETFNAQKENEVSHLIEEGLKANLRATTNIAKVTEDELWIKTQRAPELATLFGVISDKTVRILAAIERANERERELTILSHARQAQTEATIDA